MVFPLNLYYLLIIKLVKKKKKRGYFNFECNNFESEVVDNGLNLMLASWFHGFFWRLNFEKIPVTQNRNHKPQVIEQ